MAKTIGICAAHTCIPQGVPPGGFTCMEYEGDTRGRGYQDILVSGEVNVVLEISSTSLTVVIGTVKNYVFHSDAT